MNHKIEFDDTSPGMHFAGISAAPGGPRCQPPRTRMTAEDVIYRVATVTAVLFILITML